MRFMYVVDIFVEQFWHIVYSFNTACVYIYQATTHEMQMYQFYVKEKHTFTPSSVAFRCLHRTYIFFSYLIFNAIMCFHMISRRILFTKNVQKTLKMCVLNFCVSPVCMINDIFVWLFLTCCLNTKFCSRRHPLISLSFCLDPIVS